MSNFASDFANADGRVGSAKLSDSAERFAFGENWTRFLNKLNGDRIQDAEKSLLDGLRLESLAGLTFLDAGSGSGLFSLAARNLGADVTSFDYDQDSVACTAELKRRHWKDCDQWRVAQGSLLDQSFVEHLGTYDIVYCWGVAHHTGNLVKALENIDLLAKRKGRIFLSIYNDQGTKSKVWFLIKRSYVNGSRLKKSFLVAAVSGYFRSQSAISRVPEFAAKLLRLQVPGPSKLIASVNSTAPAEQPSAAEPRGMDKRTDLIDWVGGFPFEVARPDAIFNFYASRGWALIGLKTSGGGLGCNEFVFSRDR